MMRTLLTAAVWMRRPWIDAGLELLFASGRVSSWSPAAAATTGGASAAATGTGKDFNRGSFWSHSRATLPAAFFVVMIAGKQG